MWNRASTWAMVGVVCCDASSANAMCDSSSVFCIPAWPRKPGKTDYAANRACLSLHVMHSIKNRSKSLALQSRAQVRLHRKEQIGEPAYCAAANCLSEALLPSSRREGGVSKALRLLARTKTSNQNPAHIANQSPVYLAVDREACVSRRTSVVVANSPSFPLCCDVINGLGADKRGAGGGGGGSGPLLDRRGDDVEHLSCVQACVVTMST